MVAKSIYNKQLVVRALLYMVTFGNIRGWLRSSLAASFLIAAQILTERTTMGWLQNRRARKNMEKYFGKEYTDNLVTDLKEGHKAALAMRDELRKQESPEYGKLIKTINAVIDGTAANEQKYTICMELVKRSTLVDRERNDLIQQIHNIFNNNEA